VVRKSKSYADLFLDRYLPGPLETFEVSRPRK
jgi:hypothetical protein